MTTVYLALGSNTGDPPARIRQAVKLLQPLLKDLKQAPLYLSKAAGYTDQADFYNTAVSGQTDLEPTALLDRLKQIEQQVGRRPTFHHGPREIDIDIIFYDDLKLRTPELTLPHPAFAQRDFVMQPIVDLNADLIDPVSHQPVQKLLNNLTDEQRFLLPRSDHSHI